MAWGKGARKVRWLSRVKKRDYLGKQGERVIVYCAIFRLIDCAVPLGFPSALFVRGYSSFSSGVCACFAGKVYFTARRYESKLQADKPVRRDDAERLNHKQTKT
jgi:hypothetical protein